MAKKLRMFVTAHERDEQGNPTGRSETFGPGDTLPEWAEKAITNESVWEGSEDESPVFSDPGNSGPRSVEMVAGADERPTASEADQGGAQDVESRPVKGTRRASGR
ncbi:hypothetical protein [Micromonospora tulbaghiae]|uniref:hypothetical protein n=1 Tax=Micromonospora tulbaghiae TaxID=479978 RepID=UPI00340DF4D6